MLCKESASLLRTATHSKQQFFRSLLGLADDVRRVHGDMRITGQPDRPVIWARHLDGWAS
jgi:hypothetical protein